MHIERFGRSGPRILKGEHENCRVAGGTKVNPSLNLTRSVWKYKGTLHRDQRVPICIRQFFLLAELLGVQTKEPVSLLSRCLHLTKLINHRVPLAVIKIKRSEPNQTEPNLSKKCCAMNPVNFVGHLSGIVVILFGIGCAVGGHYALLWKWGCWTWRKRLIIGVFAGWGLAAFFLWNGLSILLDV
jgi:hypothetical protein